jgi:hypothetical protein
MTNWIAIESSKLKELVEGVNKEYALVCLDNENNLMIGDSDKIPDQEDVEKALEDLRNRNKFI